MDTDEESLEPHRGLGLVKGEPNTCKCPNCGHETFKTSINESCEKIKCPICKTRLINK